VETSTTQLKIDKEKEEEEDKMGRDKEMKKKT
jgi:hypothetical protein